MAVVYGEILVIIVDNLELGRRIVRLEDLRGDLVERVVVYPIDCVVKCGVCVANAVGRYVDLARRRIPKTSRIWRRARGRR